MKKIFFSSCSLFILFTLTSCHKNQVPFTQSGNWIPEAQLNGPSRSQAVSFVIDNFAYVGTGWDGLVTRFNDFWKYDPVNNVWTQVNSMPANTGRSSAVGFQCNGKGYVGTGYNGYTYLSDFYQFDPVANVWTRKADYAGSSRYEAVGFGIGNFGYVGTGFDGTYALKDFYIYDPVADSWTYLGFSGNKRYGAVAFVYNNMGYVVTGVNAGTMVGDFWKFDPDSSKWTELRQIYNYSTDSYDDGYTNIERWDGCGFIANNHAYVSSGESSGYNTNTWEYDFVADLWTEKTPFQGPPTTGAVGFSLTPDSANIGGGGYIATGSFGTGQAGSSDYLWQFFPTQVQNPNN
jgi:Kelch motif